MGEWGTGLKRILTRVKMPLFKNVKGSKFSVLAWCDIGKYFVTLQVEIASFGCNRFVFTEAGRFFGH